MHKIDNNHSSTDIYKMQTDINIEFNHDNNNQIIDINEKGESKQASGKEERN